jgi:hypothetical protein
MGAAKKGFLMPKWGLLFYKLNQKKPKMYFDINKWKILLAYLKTKTEINTIFYATVNQSFFIFN